MCKTLLYALLAAFSSILHTAEMEGGCMNTRRDFLRGGLGLSAILASGDAPAIVRSMVAARQSIAAGRKAYTARDYVQDGLTSLWDGIENAGWGVHDPNATVWKDLVTGTNNWSLTEHGEFIADGLYGDGQSAAADGASSSSFITAECCFNMRSFPSNSKKSIVAIFHTGKGSFNGRLYFVALPTASKYSVGRTSCFLWGATPPIVTIAFQNTSMSTSASGPVFLDGIEITSFSSGGYNAAGIEIPTLLGRPLSISEAPDSRSCEGVIHSIRLYSRALTADEVVHNNAVDKARFNLPTT